MTVRAESAAGLPQAFLSPDAWRRAWTQASQIRKSLALIGFVVLVAVLALRHQVLLVTPLTVMTESLPGRWFIVWLSPPAQPARGDYVCFTLPVMAGLPAGAKLIKIVAGVPGDQVTREPAPEGGWHYAVNGHFVGTAKPRALNGELLGPGPLGTIPPGHYYLTGTHPDSLDSRYARVGWVPGSALLGEAWLLF